jgi:hypothetical protein
MVDGNAKDNVKHAGCAWDRLKKIGFVMPVARDSNKLRASPMAVAAVTGTRPDLGNNRKVAI